MPRHRLSAMDTPPLQFAQAPDGTTIAYWVMGSGPPLVLNYGGFYASVADHWDLPEFRAFYQALADEWSLVCYDWRGYGNSSGEQGLENGADLDAVRGDAGLETLTLVGVSPGADVMPRYALEHPDHVARVVTWNATRHGAPLPFRTLFGLREDYPRLFHETWLLWRGWHEKSSRDQVIAMALAERGFSASTRVRTGSPRRGSGEAPCACGRRLLAGLRTQLRRTSAIPRIEDSRGPTNRNAPPRAGSPPGRH